MSEWEDLEQKRVELDQREAELDTRENLAAELEIQVRQAMDSLAESRVLFDKNLAELREQRVLLTSLREVLEDREKQVAEREREVIETCKRLEELAKRLA